jgi:hypothetical protein
MSEERIGRFALEVEEDARGRVVRARGDHA